MGDAWASESTLLRTGGVSAYRLLIPAFLGVVIGHCFFAGIIMGLAKMTCLSVFENLPIRWFQGIGGWNLGIGDGRGDGTVRR